MKEGLRNMTISKPGHDGLKQNVRMFQFLQYVVIGL